MTALYFAHLRAPDRVSVKPHASPVLHAIEYLLGRARPRAADDAARVRRPAELPEPAQGPGPGRLLDRLGRDRRDRADLERARAPLRRRATSTCPRGGRQISLVGDAELDEGACWEAIVDPIVAAPRRGPVGRRRQPPVARPDRPRHRGRPARGRCSRPPAGTCVTVKYGRRLQELFARPGGEALRRRIDAMPNEEYQRLLRARRRPSCASSCPATGADRRDIERAIADLDDDELAAAFRDLGGHDLALLLDAFRAGRRGRRPADRGLRVHDQGLAAADRGPPGQPLRRCSRAEQWESWQRRSAPTPPTRGRRSRPASAEDELCRDGGAAARARAASRSRRAPAPPADARPRARGPDLDPAGVRPLLRRPRARGARGRARAS